MDYNLDNAPLVVGCVVSLFVLVLSSAAVALEEEELAASATEVARVVGRTLVACRPRKRQSITGAGEPITRRRVFTWDRRRAEQCIEQDYLGPTPNFGLDDFKRIFRVSRTTYDAIKTCVCEEDLFFCDGFDVTGRKRVSTDAKLLISLKYLAYGCSVNAFRDYFQVGESTALLAVKRFTKCLANSSMQKKFFSFFTPSEVKRVEALHFEKHSIHGIIGSLDCSHFVWGNCAVAHHGQFQGKEGRPTIVVEALADYNLYAWHAVFGYSGTFNDISIWDSSYLLQSLCDGTFTGLDFPFTVGGEVFYQLWMLVDGIYPSLARFVKPISVPVGKRETLFSSWQESKRKDIERFFAVFKRKFGFFAKAIPFAFMEDIIPAFYCCIILHNMAVTERIRSGQEERESDAFYDCVAPHHMDCPGQAESRMERLAMEVVQRDEAGVAQRNLEVEFLTSLGIHILDSNLAGDSERIEVLPVMERLALERWNHLYDLENHKKLTKAIIRDLKQQYNEYKRSKLM
jgi:hypothetical protein